MKTSIEKQSEEYKLKLTVEFDETESSKAYAKVLKSATKGVTIPGFPKGKIPRSIVEERMGAANLKKESVNVLLDEHLQSILEKEDLKVLSVRPLEDEGLSLNGDSIKVKIDVELRPEVELFNYEKFKLDVPKAQKKELTLENELEKIARNMGEEKALSDNEGIKEFDRVKIDCEGKFENGEEISDDNFKEREFELREFMLAPGIFQQMLGMKAGEEKEIKVDFPSDYEEEDLAGKKAVYKVKVHSAKRKEPVELNDEIAIKAGCKDLEDLKTKINEYIQKTNAKVTEDRAKLLLCEKLIKESKVQLPDWMIERAITEKSARTAEEDEEITEETKKQDSKEDDKKKATEELKIAFTLSEVGIKEKVQVSDEEVADSMRNLYSMMMRFNVPRENVINRQTAEMLREQILFEKVIDCVYAKAEVNEVQENEKSLAELKELNKKMEAVFPKKFSIE